MNWEIQPFRFFGKIFFGSTLDDICRVFGDDFKVVERKLTSKTSECHFLKNHFYIHLDDEEKVTDIGVHHPEQAYFHNVQLLGRDAQELYQDLRNAGHQFQFVDKMEGLIHIDLGIGITLYEGTSRTVETFNTRMHWYDD